MRALALACALLSGCAASTTPVEPPTCVDDGAWLSPADQLGHFEPIGFTAFNCAAPEAFVIDCAAYVGAQPEPERVDAFLACDETRRACWEGCGL